jgi:DNA (cytosine-5)-methyltransferase 1
MENVKGLLSAELNGEKIFSKIIADLTTPAIVFPSYAPPDYQIYSLVKDNVETDADYLIRAEDYGVPQKRHRVILLGVRADIDIIPRTLERSRKTDLKSVIGALPPVRSGIYRQFTHTEVVNTDKGTKKARKYQNLEDTFAGWSERITAYKEELLNSFARLGYDAKFEQTLPETTGTAYRRTARTISPTHPLSWWYSDDKLKGVVQHQSRGHLTQDLKRYLFAALYSREFKKFPRMVDYRKFGTDLVPDHENAESGKFNDRFRVQLPDEPATTITSHISKDGHYFIHYDPSQCRSLTVREAARIQTFPDNYYFCGSRTQQFHQVGNAVPPYLAWQIAAVVHEILVPENARRVREPLLFEH